MDGWALSWLTENPDACAILLDLMMPEMDGFEFLDTFKQPRRLASCAGGGYHRQAVDSGGARPAIGAHRDRKKATQSIEILPRRWQSGGQASGARGCRDLIVKRRRGGGLMTKILLVKITNESRHALAPPAP